MAKETCPNCATKLTEPVSFCPTCDRPTRHANDAERLEWDLRQWRSHVDKSVAAGGIPSDEVLRSRGGVIVASPEKPLAPAARPQMIRTIEQVVEVRAVKASVTATPGTESPAVAQRDSQPRKKRRPKQRTIVLDDTDPDNAFAYRACSTCEETDWIVRTRRNEDGTWNYWCVRCSRSFKTEVKLSQAVKPFLFSGIVVGGLAAASILVLH